VAEQVGHAGHDPLRVAEAVDRDARLAPALGLCPPCVGLYADLVALTAALPGSAVPPRPRAFTLSADDARRLLPHGWRGWWSAVGSARDTVTRPLAVGFTTLGLMGLLLTAAPTLLMGGLGAGAGAPPEMVRTMAAPPQVGAPTTAGSDPIHPPNDAAAVEPDADPSATLLLSIGLLVMGSGLFVIRRVAVHGRPVR
jgi:hypothetical protein